jgi:hypothetical protein
MGGLLAEERAARRLGSAVVGLRSPVLIIFRWPHPHVGTVEHLLKTIVSSVMRGGCSYSALAFRIRCSALAPSAFQWFVCMILWLLV